MHVNRFNILRAVINVHFAVVIWSSKREPEDNDDKVYVFTDILINYDITDQDEVNIDSFHFLHKIGKGAFGEVFLVQKKDKEGTYYALKS